METRLVTAFFHNNEVGVPSHPFYLHNVIARYHRYQYSLVQLTKLGLPITLYISSNIKETINKLINEYKITNVNVIVKDLIDFNCSSKTIPIKEKHRDKPQSIQYVLDRLRLITQRFMAK